jgi:acetyltransferase-like isoleucine patch superfamily enzyme
MSPMSLNEHIYKKKLSTLEPNKFELNSYSFKVYRMHVSNQGHRKIREVESKSNIGKQVRINFHIHILDPKHASNSQVQLGINL